MSRGSAKKLKEYNYYAQKVNYLANSYICALYYTRMLEAKIKKQSRETMPPLQKAGSKSFEEVMKIVKSVQKKLEQQESINNSTSLRNVRIL